jgi:hypothetical protein
MASSYTTNKGIEKPAYQDYASDPTGWTSPVNTNWNIIDSAFGGTYSVPSLTSLSDGDSVTLTPTQCQNVRILLTGSSTTPKTITLFFPATISGFFIIDNSSDADFTINVKVTGGGPTAEYITAVYNANTLIWVDQATLGVYLADNSPLTAGTGIDVVGSTVSLEVPVTAARGGTGQTTYTQGQLLIGNAAGGLTPATLTAGNSNITITNGDGTITIAASGSAGGVTTFSAGTTGFTPTANTAGPVTLSGTLATTNGGTGLTGFGAGNRALYSTSSSALTAGTLPVAAGGTGSTSASSARSALSAAASGANSDITSLTGLTTPLSVAQGGTASTTTGGIRTTIGLATNSAVQFASLDVGDASSFTGAPLASAHAADWAIEAYSSTSSSTGYGAIITRVNNTGNPLVSFYYNSASTIVGTITTNGSGVTYGTSSDYRLKDNVSNFQDGISKIKALRPVTYTWKSNPSLGTVAGFIAHEVQAVIPQAVVGQKDAVNADGSIRPQNIDYGMLVPVLVAAIKELTARVEALEAKLP